LQLFVRPEDAKNIMEKVMIDDLCSALGITEQILALVKVATKETPHPALTAMAAALCAQ
jgi:hypothetical protein